MLEIFRALVKRDGRIAEGKLVNLRTPIPRDYRIIARWFKNTELMEFAFGVIDEDTVIHKIATDYYNDLIISTNAYAIETKGGLLIGFIRYSLRRDSEPYGRVGILIGEKSQQCKGCGTEAVTMTLHTLFKEKSLTRVELDTAVFNTRAQRCFEKCGFQKTGEVTEVNFVTGEVSHKVLMRITREEFYRLHAAEFAPPEDDK